MLSTEQTKALGFRKWLLDEMCERQLRNPSYSLRAFASSLGTSPATLSQIMSGKRPLTLKRAKIIAERCGMTPEVEQEFFLSLTNARKLASQNSEPALLQLDSDQFSLIADWYHFAILSLGEIPGSFWNSSWIAKRLGISAKDASTAMLRLERLNLIEKHGRSFRQKTRSLISTQDIPSSAIRKSHQQILAKAAKALETDSVDSRENTSMTLAIDVADMPRMKESIRAFRNEFLKEFGKSKKNNRVYNLGIHLIGLDCSETDQNNNSQGE